MQNFCICKYFATKLSIAATTAALPGIILPAARALSGKMPFCRTKSRDKAVCPGKCRSAGQKELLCDDEKYEVDVYGKDFTQLIKAVRPAPPFDVFPAAGSAVQCQFSFFRNHLSEHDVEDHHQNEADGESDRAYVRVLPLRSLRDELFDDDIHHRPGRKREEVR